MSVLDAPHDEERHLGAPKLDSDAIDNEEMYDADTASQRSISLSSAPHSPRHSLRLDDLQDPPENAHYLPKFGQHLPHLLTTIHLDSSPKRTPSTNTPTPLDLPSQHSPLAAKRSPQSYTPSEPSSDPSDDLSLYKTRGTPLTSAPPSEDNFDHGTRHRKDSEDVASGKGSPAVSCRKIRPESLLVQPMSGALVLGIALVDFNHSVGPRIEYSHGVVFNDEEFCRFLPFFALPDGAHMSAEDYSYFHLVPSTPNPSTVFGISCNMQIATSQLIAKDEDVKRSTVQKAVVVLASKPAFGPIRDKLGVVTRALFNQRDFREMDILQDFYASLESSLRTQMTESCLYMGTSIRQLVHTFRHRTLVLLKALILQKRILFYGHPVEKLCKYQYSLVSLIPDLLQTLDDCGSPPLAARAPTLSRPTSLRTSDRKSMMKYLGFPLDVFGKDAFFQPYLPLQQLDMIKETKSWLCGTTNTIVSQQKEVDLLINIESGTLEFRDPKLERAAGLTPADRKWIDDLVKDVNEGWDENDPTRVIGMQFKGSDDYLRTKFEEYISAALAAVRFGDFMDKGESSGIGINGITSDELHSREEFNPLWIAEFKRTNAYELWERTTDPMLFDIVEPRHPCTDKPSVVADLGLRLVEGIQDLKLEQQLAPTREAISRTISVGSAGFFKAVEGVRGRLAAKMSSSAGSSEISVNEIGKTPAAEGRVNSASSSFVEVRAKSAENVAGEEKDVAGARPASVMSTASSGTTTTTTSVSSGAVDAKAVLTSWGAGIGSFFSSKASKISMPRHSGGGSPGKSSLAEIKETSAESTTHDGSG